MGSEEVEEQKKKRAVAKGRFTRKAHTFTTAHSEDAPVSVLEGIYKDLESAFEQVETINEELIEVLYKVSGSGKLIDEANEYISELESQKIKVKIMLEKAKLANNQCVHGESPKVSVKKLNPPTFSGDMRQFPSFKGDYERLVVPTFGQDPYALRQCLTGEALQAVRGLEDDYKGMFERLNQKYGNHRQLVDLIISDLRALKPLVDGDDKGLIKMIDTVERCYLDLKKMKLEAEMNSTNVLSLIERVMPPLQKREWVALIDEDASNSVQGCGLDFKRLLNYLLTQKRRIEYMGSVVRNVALKSSVNSAQCTEPRNTDIHIMMKNLQENQASMEKQLVNVTKAITNLTDNSNIYKRKSTEVSEGCWFHESYTHDTQNCHSFKALSDKEKMEMLKRKGLCFNCISGQHLAKNCTKGGTCPVMTSNNVCNMRHHPLLHRAHVDGIMYHSTGKLLNDHGKVQVMLMISSINHNGYQITTLWDSGSNITVITHSLARKLGLSGKNVTLDITKVGNVTETYSTKEYEFPIVDKKGNVWHIRAYGMEEITARATEVNTFELSKIFGLQPQLLVRPVGRIDMLIGSDCCQLLPRVIRTIGNLQLLENQFGYCVRGSVTSNNDSLNHSSTRVTLNHVAVNVRSREIGISEVPDLKESLDKVYGSDLNQSCESCKCKQDVSDDCTIREKRELDLMEQGLTYDHINKVWIVKYPWVKDPKDLPNNFAGAVPRMKATEKRLNKLGPGYCRVYQDQIKDMIAKGVARKLTKEEVESHVGPVHYIHHHEVMKPDSSSTPMRIVFDSSATYYGHQLNSYWAKGPDLLNSLLGVLLRMRQDRIVVMGDISRMYHTIKLDERDQHTHRFIWRDLDDSKPPEHYVLTTVTFGDRPSGVIATLALRHTAEMFLNEHPDAAHMIMRNTYVDDMVQSVQSEKEAHRLIREAEYILAMGGFVVKHWVISGREKDCKGIRLLQAESEKVLGMSWDINKDQFFYKVRINFSSKYKNVHTQPNLSRDELEIKCPETLTRRMVLSQVASVFDPLGLVQPVLLSAKLLMREMIIDSKGEGWDEPLKQEYRMRWINFFDELYKLENIRFKRAIRPENAVGDPVLILFSDGSKHSYGAVAYCRFLTQSGDYETSIIMAKNKITPAKMMSVPRIELCGAVLSCRLRERIELELDWQFKSVYHIVDSEIVRAQIQKDSHKLKSFVGTRIAEIQTKSDPREWWWVGGENNPADMLTRKTEIEHLDMNSVWQRGPDFLKLPIQSWPIFQKDEVEVPDMIGQTITADSNLITTVDHTGNEQPSLSVIKLERFSSYGKLLRVTSRILAVAKAKSFKAAGNKVDTSSMRNAEKLWVKEAQKDISAEWQKRFERLGPAMNKDGIITVGSRMKSWLKQNWNSDTFMLLPAKHNFTLLYISHLHEIDHSGIDTTIAKLQLKYWVPGARRIVKSVKHKCVTCNKLSPKSEGQRMGELVDQRLKPSPPFCYTACDMFGPFKIRDTIKRRTLGKAFGIIFNCLATRGVHLDLIEGYDTQSFLKAFRRFVAVRGYPCTMFSDRGPQFMSASKELKQVFRQQDWQLIYEFGKGQGMEWVFTKSADSPWQNGVSEALIKSVKRSLKVVIGDSTFTFSELQTVLFEVANLLNERPIGIKPGSDVETGSYLCPNELLLGRASNHAPVGKWTQSNTSKRLDFMNNVVTGFWRKWQRDFFPTLLVQQKWHVATRNVRVGDLVLVQDSNALRGVWKLATVTEAQAGRDGLVRDVTVRYKHLKAGSKYSGSADVHVKRSVHRIAVILPIEDQ